MKPIHDGPWGMMLLLSFSAAFLLPRQFHMLFVENIKPSNLSFASWAFPLFLLLLNIKPKEISLQRTFVHTYIFTLVE